MTASPSTAATRFAPLFLLLGAALCLAAARPAFALSPSPVEQWREAAESNLLDYYEDPGSASAAVPPMPAAMAKWTPAAKSLIEPRATANSADFPATVGTLRAHLQQAIVLEMAAAVKNGRIRDAQALRADLDLPRGVSANEGALLLQTLAAGKGNRHDAARVLVRESLTWQITRVRQLLAAAARSTKDPAPMPGRLNERLAEAITLAAVPQPLRDAAGLKGPAKLDAATLTPQRLALVGVKWDQLTAPLLALQHTIEEHLPNLLSDAERHRQERLLLKLVTLIPREYANGVRDGKVTVPLEYREAVTFLQQARQISGELAPIWLGEKQGKLADAVAKLDTQLQKAEELIDAKRPQDTLQSTLSDAANVLGSDFDISLKRYGSTADIVDEVMVETRSLLSNSLAQAIAGNWTEAERLRLEAYTTYDPELEARLLPRDPQLARDIERLLLDGTDHPGVKALLDRHASAAELTAAYDRVNEGLQRAAAMLKSSIEPAAAVFNAFSIVLREGLEGLLVIIAVFAGLRGEENRHPRRLVWGGVVLAFFATVLTWILSQTLIYSLRAYSEVISAIAGVLAIGVLLLITNWLFHQVYWRQWVTTLKSQATTAESAWQLVTVGFLVGYREGFETVLFLQSLTLDAGKVPVLIGVAIAATALLVLGFLALKLGMQLPYFKILLVTAFMIGAVLITFVGNTVRAIQSMGWMPVHRLTGGSWPMWVGDWLGFYNTCESVGLQVLICLIVLGTWRFARWQAKHKAAQRRLQPAAA